MQLYCTCFFFLKCYWPHGFLVMKYSLEKPDSSWLWMKESLIGMVYCACFIVHIVHCGIKNDVYTRVVRLLSPVHF